MTKLAKTTLCIQALVATLLLTTLTLPALAQSDIYKVTHPDGSISFTDQPPSGSDSSSVELLDNNRINIIPGLASKPETTEAGAESDELVVSELMPKSVSILSPIDQTTIPMGPGHFSVLAEVEPELEPALEAGMLPEPELAVEYEAFRLKQEEERLELQKMEALAHEFERFHRNASSPMDHVVAVRTAVPPTRKKARSNARPLLGWARDMF